MGHDQEPADADEAEEKAALAAFVESQNESVRQFIHGADLLIYDAAYTAEEYPQKRGWGHTWIEYAVEDAKLADVGELWLSHHDPTRTDDAIDAIAMRLDELVGDSSVKASFAREGGVWHSASASVAGEVQPAAASFQE